VLCLELPTEREKLIEKLVDRGRAHFPDCKESILRKAATQLADDRQTHRERDLSPPGLAEYVDLVRAVTELRPDDEMGQGQLLDEISKFMYRKHPPEQMR
jgi:hypothetical protein